MKVIIAGAGSVGRYMAGQLQSSGHEVTLLDQDRGTLDRLGPEAAAVTIAHGDGCEIDTLARIGAADADVVAAVTGDDEDNLVISLLAKQEFGVPRVVGRVNNPNNEWMFNETWGVDVAVSTPHLLTGLVEEAVNVGSVVRLLTLDHGRAHLVEVTLAPSSPAVGCEVASVGMPSEATVVAVLRKSQVVVPRPDLTLQAGDEVMVLYTGDADDDVRAALVG